MQIDTAILAIMVTILIGLFSFSAWVGALHQKVKDNRDQISNIHQEFKIYQENNKADHNAIGLKLDKILINGRNQGR